MKRKTSLVPARVYKYGLPKGPRTNADLVLAHLELAQTFYNKLIEIRRGSMPEYQALVTSPEIESLRTERSEVAARVKVLENALARNNSEVRRKNSDPNLKKWIQGGKQLIAALTERLKEVRESTAAEKAPEIEALNKATNLLQREARAKCGLHDGTYNLISGSAFQAASSAQGLPEFKHRADGLETRAVLGQQIKSGSGRLWASEPADPKDKWIFGGKDTRIRIDPPGHKGRTTLHFCLDTDAKRKPIWVEFPMVMHRPLPSDAEIKKVLITRTRIGPNRGPIYTRWRWEACFFLESWKAAARPETKTGHVAAVDIGWSLSDDSGMRVGYLAGSDGVRAEIVLPYSILERLRIPESLASTRKLVFNKFLERLKDYLRDNPLPELEERLTFVRKANEARQIKESRQPLSTRLANLKSSNRLAQIVWEWKTNRVPGDESIWKEADDWRRTNVHLHQWHANAQDSARRTREQWFSVLACRLAKRYEKIYFEDLDLSRLARSKIGGTNRSLVSPGQFRKVTEAKVGENRLPAAGTSRTCSACGGRCEWDFRSYKLPVCGSCGTVWDRDQNAAINLLKASGAVITETHGALELQELQGLPAPNPLRGPRSRALQEAAE